MLALLSSLCDWSRHFLNNLSTNHMQFSRASGREFPLAPWNIFFGSDWLHWYLYLRFTDIQSKYAMVDYLLSYHSLKSNFSQRFHAINKYTSPLAKNTYYIVDLLHFLNCAINLLNTVPFDKIWMGQHRHNMTYSFAVVCLVGSQSSLPHRGYPGIFTSLNNLVAF